MSLTQPAEALNLDQNQQRLFITFFHKLPEKPQTTIRIFNHCDYFTVHGAEDTKIASDFTKNPVKLMGTESKLPYVVLRKIQFEQFIRELLLIKQYRIEVYTKTNKITDWKLEFKASPGNVGPFEDILYENTNLTFSNQVLGIKVHNKTVAIASISNTELQFSVCEIEDNDLFTELETIIAQINPRECVLYNDDKTLKKLLERNGVLVAKCKKSDFSNENIVQDLNRLLFFPAGQQRNASSFAETNLTEAMSSLNAVIKFLDLTSDSQNFNQYRINTIEANRYVRLDNAALYSLNVLSKSDKDFSLKTVLDRCITNQGKRLLDQWLKQPLKDLNLIEERLDIVESLLKCHEVREDIANILTKLPDLLILSRKLSAQKATLQDCYKVYQNVCIVPDLIDKLTNLNNPCVKSVLIDPLSELSFDLEKFKMMIEEVIDLDLVDRNEFLVKHSFSEDLKEIYEAKRKIEEKMQKVLRRTVDQLDMEEKSVKLECNDQYGYFFRVTLKEEQALRKNNTITVLDAVKGGVRFTNDALTDLNSEYESSKKAYEEQQEAVLKEVLDVASGYGGTLRAFNVQTATIDVLVSFAKSTKDAKIPYTRPKLLPADSGVMKLSKIRHPCIEQQECTAFIPNSVEFDAEKCIFHIITGPNMCGKSTFIRSVGICVLMAQIGCFVPCEEAEFAIRDAILARVGAEDCESKGLSTFMVEMVETATIVQTATSNSLVIIDELGRGTSTYDGCGIAFAIAEHLAKEVECFSLFATHFHEITRLAEVVPKVNNLHVTAVTTEDTITPLYQVKQGECDNSYGIHCARMVDFPPDVIESALRHQKELEHSEGTQFIQDLEPALKRQIIKEGDAIIDGSLNRLKDIKSDEELLKTMAELKKELEISDNLFVKGLLNN